MSRVKIKMSCKCGESFVLRGSLMSDGHMETGFKQCFCGNADPKGFNVKILEQYESRNHDFVVYD